MLNLIKLFGSSVFIKFFHINIVFLYCFMLLLFFAGLIQIKYIAVILIKNKKWMLMSNKNVFELFLMRVAPSFALNAHKNEIKIQKNLQHERFVQPFRLVEWVRKICWSIQLRRSLSGPHIVHCRSILPQLLFAGSETRWFFLRGLFPRAQLKLWGILRNF